MFPEGRVWGVVLVILGFATLIVPRPDHYPVLSNSPCVLLGTTIVCGYLVGLANDYSREWKVRVDSRNLGIALKVFSRRVSYLTDGKDSTDERALRREYVDNYMDRIVSIASRLAKLQIAAPGMDDLWLMQINVPLAKQAELAANSFSHLGQPAKFEARRLGSPRVIKVSLVAWISLGFLVALFSWLSAA